MTQQKKYYPKKVTENNNNLSPNKKKYYPKQNHVQQQHLSKGFFNGNLAKDMKFGAPGDNLSGYVKREIRMKDRFGNETIASEQQFFNSGANLEIEIQDHGPKHKK